MPSRLFSCSPFKCPASARNLSLSAGTLVTTSCEGERVDLTRSRLRQPAVTFHRRKPDCGHRELAKRAVVKCAFLFFFSGSTLPVGMSCRTDSVWPFHPPRQRCIALSIATWRFRAGPGVDAVQVARVRQGTLSRCFARQCHGRQHATMQRMLRRRLYLPRRRGRMPGPGYMAQDARHGRTFRLMLLVDKTASIGEPSRCSTLCRDLGGAEPQRAYCHLCEGRGKGPRVHQQLADREPILRG